MKSEVQHALPASTASTHRLICPLCKRPNMHRVARSGFLQRKVFPLFGYYPWECSTCRVEKLFKLRGLRRKRKSKSAD